MLKPFKGKKVLSVNAITFKQSHIHFCPSSENVLIDWDILFIRNLAKSPGSLQGTGINWYWAVPLRKILHRLILTKAPLPIAALTPCWCFTNFLRTNLSSTTCLTPFLSPVFYLIAQRGGPGDSSSVLAVCHSSRWSSCPKEVNDFLIQLGIAFTRLPVLCLSFQCREV